MTGWEATKLDKGDLYMEYDTDMNMWLVLGEVSGFCYRAFMNRDSAKEFLQENQNNSNENNVYLRYQR